MLFVIDDAKIEAMLKSQESVVSHRGIETSDNLRPYYGERGVGLRDVRQWAPHATQG